MIHKYTMNGMNIVIDVNSGAVHAVDEVVFNILDYYVPGQGSQANDGIFAALGHKYTDGALQEGLEEINELAEGGLLFSPDIYEAALPSIERRPTVVKAMCMHVAHDCNLRCAYCFAGEGKYHGERGLMSPETGKLAIDFLIASSGGRYNLEVDFFGGEPTLNFETVKQVTEYAKQQGALHNKSFRLTLTTNGLLLDEEMQSYINENMDNVVLSIDGRKEINDRMRKTPNGSGSYDIIMPRLKKMAASREQADHYVRGTFTRENLDFAEDVIHLAEQGFRHISVEPVVADSTAEYALTEADLPRLFTEYEKLAAYMLDRLDSEEPQFSFFHFLIDLSGGPCVAKRLTGCGAGTEYLAVTPEGDLYPCHQFVGMPDFKMGDVESGVTNTEKRDEFARNSVYSKKKCGDCWAKFYCSGGCAAGAYNTHGDISKPYEIGCELLRKRTECAIMLKVAEKTRFAIDAQN